MFLFYFFCLCVTHLFSSVSISGDSTEVMSLPVFNVSAQFEVRRLLSQLHKVWQKFQPLQTALSRVNRQLDILMQEPPKYVELVYLLWILNIWPIFSLILILSLFDIYKFSILLNSFLIQRFVFYTNYFHLSLILVYNQFLVCF